jgi:hypothetical protein
LRRARREELEKRVDSKTERDGEGATGVKWRSDPDKTPLCAVCSGENEYLLLLLVVVVVEEVEVVVVHI